jgi:hypothetical protein
VKEKFAKRSTGDFVLQQEFLREVIGRLEGLGVIYAITGSIASNFWGIPRLTHDVDVLIVLSPGQVPGILACFPSPYYVSEQAAKEAVTTGRMFNLIDPRSGLKADLWVFKGDPFDQSMLNRRQQVELLPGLQAHVGSAEDVLLHKLVWHKMNPSERQLGDAAGIVAVQAGKLELGYLRDWASKLTAADLLEEILQGKWLKQT